MRRTALEEYCEDVLSGRVAACRKLRAGCGRILGWVREPYGGWHFDPDAAERPVRFIERFCRVPSGRLGAPMALEPYEKAWVEAMFGFVDDRGLRRFTEAFIAVGRKNGKTSLAAALELYMLVADGEGSPQVYNAANTAAQAELGFRAVQKMVAQSRDLAAHVRKRSADLHCDINMGYVMPLAANVSALDGLDVHFAVIDEIHAMRNREVYDLLKQGTGAREQPMVLQITTNGFVRGSIFDAQYDYASRWAAGEVDDDRFLAFVYELDDRDEWRDEACWPKANPGLGTVKRADYLRAQVAKAESDPGYLATVMTKDFNLPENQSMAWLTYEEAVNEERFEVEGFDYAVLGYDAADTVDLTAAKMLMMRRGDDRIYELSMYWMPEAVLLESDARGDRRGRDGVPYRQWVDRGLMRTVPGNVVPKSVVVDWAAEVMAEHDVYVFAAGVDPWHIDDRTREGLEQLCGKDRLVFVRQVARTLSGPMKQLRADLGSNRIVDGHNPINEWCRMNVAVKADVNGNIQPDKKNRDPRNRIDGFVAELCAYTVLDQFMEEYRSLL